MGAYNNMFEHERKLFFKPLSQNVYVSLQNIIVLCDIRREKTSNKIIQIRGERKMVSILAAYLHIHYEVVKFWQVESFNQLQVTDILWNCY